jgi:hypothetical protein
VITCFASGSITAFGLYLLSICAMKTKYRHSSFHAVSQLTFPTAAVFFDAAIAMKCFGVSIRWFPLGFYGNEKPEPFLRGSFADLVVLLILAIWSSLRAWCRTWWLRFIMPWHLPRQIHQSGRLMEGIGSRSSCLSSFPFHSWGAWIVCGTRAILLCSRLVRWMALIRGCRSGTAKKLISFNSVFGYHCDNLLFLATERHARGWGSSTHPFHTELCIEFSSSSVCFYMRAECELLP